MGENGILNQFSQLNIPLREEWLNSRISANIDDVFHQFLFDDMSACAQGSFPPNVQTSHNITLKGVHTLQVNSCEDINQSIKQRREAAMEFVEKIEERGRSTNLNKSQTRNANLNRSNRILKLLLSDGRQQIFAFEYRKWECNVLCTALETLKKVCDTNLLESQTIAANRKLQFKKIISTPKVVVCGEPLFRNGILLLQSCNIKLLWPGVVVDCDRQ